MSEAKDNAVVRVKEKNGKRRQIGKVWGDTFHSFERVEEKHLFRGGSDTHQQAIKNGTGAWGLDVAAMEQLQGLGIQYVEIPTKDHRWRCTMETLLGPKSYIVEYGGHRPQVMLPLEYWHKVPLTAEEKDLVPVTKFGQTRMVPRHIQKDGKVSRAKTWERVLWVEREEDRYALMSRELKDRRVLVVDRDTWIKGKLIARKGGER